jgi:hypothetical protein
MQDGSVLTAAETAEEVKTATDSFNASIQSGAKVLRLWM